MCQDGYTNYDPTQNVSDQLSDNERVGIKRVLKNNPNLSVDKAKDIYYKELTLELEDY